MQHDANTEVGLKTRIKAALIIGLVAGVVTVGLSPFVGMIMAVVIASVSVGVGASIFVRFRLRWPVRPGVRRFFDGH
jgi:hypothetical protein